MMKKPILHIFILAFSVINHANGQNISCMNQADSIRLILNDDSQKYILIQTKNNACIDGFSFIADPINNDQGYIFLSPPEPDLKAEYRVYRVSFTKNTTTPIGNLPISSENTENNIFTDIQQSGSSLYMKKYELTPLKIKENPTSWELAIDGKLCLDDTSNVWNTEISIEKNCKNIFNASFKNPICLVHRNGKTILSKRSNCREIERYK